MDKRVIPFSPPDMSEDEINEVADTLRNGWITTGPKVKEFERQIAKYVGVNKAVCLNSQTACAEMALRVLGVGEGNEVIVPAYTYTASASVVCHVGAKLVLVDVQKDSLEMDYDALEKAITEKTKVIIPVDLGGVPCDYDRIDEIVEKKKHLFKPSNKIQEAMGRISVNADTAHAFGASWHGKMCGSIADFSSFSFHAVKNLTTAEGGALTWRTIEGIDDEDIYKQLQLLSLHGQSKDALAKTKLGAWEYDVVAPLYKCNMTDIMGGIGLAQMRRYPGMLKRRKEIIERYNEVLTPLGVEVLNHYDEDHQSSGHLYITRVPNITGDQRNDIITKMAERGIACNVHYKPLPMLSAYKNLGFDIKDYPNAYNQFVNEITLPLHTKLSDEDVEYIIEKLQGDYFMLVKEWNELPEYMQVEEVRPYYEILRKKKGQLILKRIFDLCASLVLIVLLSPIILFFSIWIKLDSKGPVFYRQERITQYGKVFRIFKFRTMVNNADKIGNLVTSKNDSRITKVGEKIRKYRIDEIPQLFNVLIGDMSFVGTRPEVKKYVDQYTPEMYATLLLPAGVTSLASIEFKDEDEILERYTSNGRETNEVYVNKVLPLKMEYNLKAIISFNFIKELGTMISTVVKV